MKPPSVTQTEMLAARKRLMLGASLEDAAGHIGLEPAHLDLLLWRRLCRLADAGQVRRSA